MNIDKYIELLNRKENINFIATAMTKWHVLSIDASSLYIKDKYNEILKGYFFFYSNDNKEDVYHINENDTILKEKEIDKIKTGYGVNHKHLSIIEKIKLIKYGLNSKKYNDNIYIFAPSRINWIWLKILKECNIRKKIIFVVCDEGSGSINLRTFSGTLKMLSANHHISRLKERVIVFFKSIVIYLYSDILYRIFNRSKQIINTEIYKILNEKYLVNKEIIIYYKTVFKKKAYEDYYENSIIYNSTVLINTKKGVIDIDEYFLKKIIEIIKNNGIKLILKFHPSDNKIDRFSKLNVSYEKRNDESQEMLLSKQKYLPKCIIGVASSTLLNTNVIFGIKTISLAKILYNLTDNKEIKEMMKVYINRYSHNVTMPENMEELEHILMSL